MTAVTSLAPVGGDGTTRVRVTVPFDRCHTPELRLGLSQAITQGSGPVVVDLSRSTVLDATGFATLRAAHVRAVRAGRRLRVVGADERCRRLLRRARLGHLLVDDQEPLLARSTSVAV